MERLKIAMVARELGITAAGVYKRLKKSIQLVDNHVVKENGITYLTREGVEALRGMIQKPVSFDNSTGIQPVESPETKHLKEIIANQQRTIDTLVASQEEARKRTDTILMKLTSDISGLQKSLEFKPQASQGGSSNNARSKDRPDDRAGIINPEPRKLKDPLADSSWVEKLLIYFFAPERMRRFEP